jgi:hypothetical protein
VSRLTSAQALLGIEAIEEGMLRLGGGRCRAVLEVASVNFALKSEAERDAIVAGYAAFLNGLTHPLQVLVLVLPIDLDRHLADLERRAREELSPLLADLARDHVAFLRRLARNRTLLERRFYVVVPAQAATDERRPPWWPFRRRAAPGLGLAAARRQLTHRCDEVAKQLARCGLAARRLRGTEIAALEHACWCPELARVQRIRRALDDYTALVVGADDPLTGGNDAVPASPAA